MGRQHVDHGDIVRFAEERVNLPKDKADEYRAQARRLRERLESYLSEHPDFTLKKMLLSGSLAKGTALRSLNDIDVACYISGADAPGDVAALLDYLAERLRKAFPNFSPDQVQPQTYSVTVSFRGIGSRRRRRADPLRRRSATGTAISSARTTARSCETSIPLHLEFARKRKDAQETHFAQVVRLVKFWARNDEARARGFPVQVLHDRADPGAPCAIRGSISPTTPRRCSTSSPTSRAATCASGSSSPDYYKPGDGRLASPSRCRSSIRSTPRTTSAASTPTRRPTRSSMPRSMPATPSMPRSRRPPSRRPSATGRRSSAPSFQV